MTLAFDALTSFTPRNLDSEIEHLEHVLAGDAATSLFGRTYWRNRVVKARATPGLVPSQRSRLERLLSVLTDPARRPG
ncbi:conserved protein of unknown function (plasmid) [Caballeronia sp. S22]